ncbi:PREDICTED: glycerol-3-phosphate acyltransferase 1, mitochondrial-like isoform X2 [Priapulus caudatus]|nr:PREDICTED: glycerol-3-phosphate acyltransferase 1, mitochondrial-like isoform X2 [Priapulus caudatus]XP_014672917.1 PREDICTED: glycerol-3-phosphate acyltransferase 1, mitochondrial-like isoform X2 [Priapulus caudatus]
MSAELLQNLNSVYDKWEKKAQPYGLRNSVVKQIQDRARRPSQRPGSYMSDRHNGFTGPSMTLGRRLGQFKVAPTTCDAGGKYRPFMGLCCNVCVPLSRNNFFDKLTADMDLKNNLIVSTQNRNCGYLTRKLCYATFSLQRKCSHRYPKLNKTVLENERVLEAIHYAACEDDNEIKTSHASAVKTHKKRAKEVLTKMAAAISSAWIRLTGWVLLRVFNHMLDSIQVHQGQMEMVKKAAKSNIPVIFLPLHKSHLDYLLLTFILFLHDIKAPHVAAGDNLSIPVFRYILRSLGGFFIKRKLDPHYGKKDIVYRALLHTYMAELLRRGQYVEFFIEGGRTRSGKAGAPKAGLMSVVIDTFIDGTVTDAYLIPVSITYEKVLDGEFIRENMGSKKVPETFWGAVKAIWRVLKTNYGHVRVTFCQPFSLQEYVQSVQTSSGRGFLTDGGMGLKDPSESSLYGTDVVEEDQRQLVTNVATHVVHAAVHASAVMSTNLLAFLLLVNYRKGVSMKELVRSFDWVKEEVLFLDRDLGFSGETTAVIAHALSILDNHLVNKASSVQCEQTNNNIENWRLSPNLSLPDVFGLTYYANSVTSVFLIESVIVNAVLALSREQCSYIKEDSVVLPKQRLIRMATQLCSLLQFEFIFTPPCTSLQTQLLDGLDRLVASEVLSEELVVKSRHADEAWTGNSGFCWDSSSDEDDDANTVATKDALDDRIILKMASNGGQAKLHFLENVLQSLIETYCIAAAALPHLLGTTMTENNFQQRLQKLAIERVERGQTSYPESVSMDTLRNCTRLFEKQNVIALYYLDTQRMLELDVMYDTEVALAEYLHVIELFRSSRSNYKVCSDTDVTARS